MRIILLGAPGSGKAGHAAKISKRYGIPRITSGDILREISNPRTAEEKQLKKTMESGDLAPDQIIMELLTQRLSRPDTHNGFILIGFPRNLLQAQVLDQLLNRLKTPLDAVLEIKIANEALMERMVGRQTCGNCGERYNIYSKPPIVDGTCDVCGNRLRQRADDNETAISNRLRVYENLITPVTLYYQDKNLLLRVKETDDTLKLLKVAVADTGSKPTKQPPTKQESLQPKTVTKVEAKPVKKKTPTKKQAAKRKPAAKKPALAKKKIAAKETSAPTKKTAIKKAPVKKKTAAKNTVKKTTTKKTAAKKAPSKKAALKKKPVVAKKIAKKKTAAKTPVAKKKVAKKPPVRKKSVPARKTAKKKAKKH